MFIITFILLFNLFEITWTRAFENKLDRYIISCHSTDFECFKRQYSALRDHVLLGNPQLAIETYKSFTFKYGDTGTCVKFSGVDESKLEAIHLDSTNNELSIVLGMPLRLQQVRNDSALCAAPDRDFEPIGVYNGSLKSCSGNATVLVTYPYKLRTVKGEVYMMLEDENLDITLDIPYLGEYDTQSKLESKMYEWSDWGYDMVSHVDVPRRCLFPYTAQIKTLFETMPLERFLLLYPEEEYHNIHFMYADKTSQ